MGRGQAVGQHHVNGPAFGRRVERIGGAVGPAVVGLGGPGQVAAFGAEVTGVCSTRNLDLLRSLGADRVLDYTRQRITDDGCSYDVVFDTVGETCFADVRVVLSRRGRYLVTAFRLRELLQMVWTRFDRGPRVIGGASNFHWTHDDLELLAGMMAAGQLRAVVDRCYAMTEAAAAHRYVETRRKRGNVVLRIGL